MGEPKGNQQLLAYTAYTIGISSEFPQPQELVQLVAMLVSSPCGCLVLLEVGSAGACVAKRN